MKKALFILLLIQITSLYCFAQSFDSLVNQYNAKFPQEKIYIHFDNNSYLPGSDIGFKAYLMNGPEPSKLNRNLYTDWYDSDGNLLAHQTSPILLSSAFGTFSIPLAYKGNAVTVIAYTGWMLNFDSAFLFRKQITILQPTVSLPTIATLPSYRLQFFPEGGEMVNGLTSFVAFKATDNHGNPFPVKAVIRNDKEEEIARFQSVHDGMGKFALIPDTSAYYAEWTAPDGIVRRTSLPKVLFEGITMQVNTIDQSCFVRMYRSAELMPSLRKLTMLMTINQQIVSQTKVDITNTFSTQIKIPLSDLPSGIATITLLNSYQEPVCERVIFINNEEYKLNAEIRLDTINTEKLAKNVIEINLPDTIPVNMSFSVTNDDYTEESTDPIYSSLLLSADIKGKIHNPAFYFTSPKETAQPLLDLVMLTNGWRRIIWKKVFDTTQWHINYPMDTTYIALFGNVEGLNEKKLLNSETINLILLGKDSSRQVYIVPVSSNGFFQESKLFFYDTAKLFFQLNKLQFLPGKASINFSTNLLDSPVQRKVTPFITTTYDSVQLEVMRKIIERETAIRKLKDVSELKEVIVTSRIKTRIEQMDELYTSGLFRSFNSISFDLIKDQRALSSFSIFDFLKGRIAGLNIQGSVIGRPTVNWSRSPVTFYLDEIPTDAELLASIPMSNLAYVKLIRAPFFGPLSAGNAAISVYTKKGNDMTENMKGLESTLLKGYTMVKEFYQPDYSMEAPEMSKPDNRRALYWQPNIITDGSTRTIKLVFYNNSSAKKFKFVLEGINDNGQFISIRKLLE
jgi:hypothetical protein